MNKPVTTHSLPNILGEWAAHSPNRQVLNVTIIIALITAFTKIFYLGKDLLVANLFGRADDLDAFLIAYVVPTFVINIMTAQLSAALIPIFIQERQKHGKESADRLLSNITTFYLTLLCVIAFFVSLGTPYYLPYLASGFDANKLDLTRYLTYILVINILLNGLAALWRAVLNASEQFALPALSAIGTPIGMIFFLFFFPELRSFTLAYGMVLGILIEVVILGWAMVTQKFPVLPTSFKLSDEIRQILRQYGLLIAGAIFMACTNLVDQSMTASLSSGSVAALSYGSKLPTVPISLIVMALGTAILPYASKLVSENKWAGLRHMLNRYLWLIFIVTVPFTVLFSIFSEPIIQLIFQRGAFTHSDTTIVAFVQSLYVLQIPFFTAYILISRLITSLQENSILVWTAGIALIAKIIFNFLLMNWLGVAGIALSTSLMYFLVFLLNWVFFVIKLSKLERQ